MNKKDDWFCPTCEFTIWGSKPKCLKCGYDKPKNYWVQGDSDPRWERCGPYSILKGGYYGDRLTNEPENLTYPNCGCKEPENCPKRHHLAGCCC